jgi:hypothetical protein
MNQLSLLPRQKQDLAPGAVHIPDWLSLEEQQQLLNLCREWAKPPAGLYTPKMLDGTLLSVLFAWASTGIPTNTQKLETTAITYPVNLFQMSYRVWQEKPYPTLCLRITIFSLM